MNSVYANVTQKSHDNVNDCLFHRDILFASLHFIQATCW